MRYTLLAGLAATVLCLPCSGFADEGPKASKKNKGLRGDPLEILASLNSPEADEDFAALCVDQEGTPWVAYIEFDGKVDTLQLASLGPEGFAKVGALSKPGNIYQPGLACDGEGTVWCVWSQLNDGRWSLHARSIVDGKINGRAIAIAEGAGNHVFPDVKADPEGRVWVTWQSFDQGRSEIYTKYFDPQASAWSDSIRVTNDATGDWEPRLAFADGREALIVFDSYRNGNFDIFLTRVSPKGQVDVLPVSTSERYQGRAEAAGAFDGSSVWVAYEDGVSRWGKDLGSEWRRLGGGLHFDRHLYLANVDLATGKTRQLADVTPLVPGMLATLGQPTSGSICLPELVVDDDGCPWLFFRIGTNHWEVAVTKYDPNEDTWTRPQRISQSTYCQDRRICAVKGADGSIYVVCPSDGRTGNDQGDSGIRLARLDPREDRPVVDAAAFAVEQKRAAPAFESVNETPERPRDHRFRWKHKGDEYTLYWGDLHRHTDFSNCRSPDDGCIVEHFRYAYDAGGIDFLATTDHSDQGRGYTDYEWWQTQKLADMFHTPDFFLTLYGYEREQKGPYGHRNVFFKERGGPIVYINRDRFAESQWGERLGLPPQAGAREGDLSPPQLWQLLRNSGMDAISISHTPAGNDWTLFDEVDIEVEPVMEIYQGSRQSYEGAGTPQPKVANQKTVKSSKNPGKGKYQNALSTGHRLGAIGSSDHRSTNISYAGLYLKTFDREGLFEAIRARRTFAATDKILMHVACDGHTLGEEFSTDDRPTLELFVDGTAPLKNVTVIRNEAVVYSRRITDDSSTYEGTFRDEQPVPGENRYYVRVEQVDGNMGWTSPIWVEFGNR